MRYINAYRGPFKKQEAEQLAAEIKKTDAWKDNRVIARKRRGKNEWDVKCEVKMTMEQLMKENDRSLREDYDKRGYHKKYHEHKFADFGVTTGYKKI